MAALVAFVTSPDGRAALSARGAGAPGAPGDPRARRAARPRLVDRAAELEAAGPARWVWWSAATDAWPLASARLPLARCWDVAEAHRLLVGGWEATPQVAWAAAHRLDARGAPRRDPR